MRKKFIGFRLCEVRKSGEALLFERIRMFTMKIVRKPRFWLAPFLSGCVIAGNRVD